MMAARDAANSLLVVVARPAEAQRHLSDVLKLAVGAKKQHQRRAIGPAPRRRRASPILLQGCLAGAGRPSHRLRNAIYLTWYIVS